MRIYRGDYAYVYVNVCVCTVFRKKNTKMVVKETRE
jgi:hypothetical protein